MNKKKLILTLFILLLISITVGVFIKKKFFNSSAEPSSPVAESQKVEEKKEEFHFDWVEWQDPAGFAFEYPKEVKIDKHPEDEDNYAHLELTKDGRKGRIIIIVNDAKYKDIDEWVEKDELAKSGSAVKTEIASTSAKRVALEEGREIAAFIDLDKVIYQIDNQAEGEDYWQEIYGHILASLRLIPLKGESEKAFNDWMGGFKTSGVDIIETLEVIE